MIDCLFQEFWWQYILFYLNAEGYKRMHLLWFSCHQNSSKHLILGSNLSSYCYISIKMIFHESRISVHLTSKWFIICISVEKYFVKTQIRFYFISKQNVNAKWTFLYGSWVFNFWFWTSHQIMTESLLVSVFFWFAHRNKYHSPVDISLGPNICLRHQSRFVPFRFVRI